MKCPNCQSVNEEREKFCRTCGARLGVACPDCGSVIFQGDRFCAECGRELKSQERFPKIQEEVPSERKHVTALFADISGYTALGERLDPEELKDIVGNLIGEMAKVVTKYQGSVENFSGDQIMALFGFPRTHEDDALRAVKAATEIHRVVGEISQKVREAIEQPLVVHIGINSGLAITGQADFNHLTHHIAGDTVNIAARLCTLAQPGETMVGQTTYIQTEGFYCYDPLQWVQVKGKVRPIQAYRLLSPRESPSKTHRISGRRAALIGRQREMAVLAQAVASLREGGEYAVIAIYGEAGTGKSRLIEEFRTTLDLKEIRWMEGHAYAYTQNISYSPLINLIKRDLAIEEGDTPGKVAAKLQARLEGLRGLEEDVAPYLGGLLSLHYLEVAEMSPEFWKSRLHEAILATLRAQAKQGPVVICFEDLQWADPMFLDFLRRAVLEQIPGVILLYTYRPPLEMFSQDEIRMIGGAYQEIHLQDLSLEESQEMVESMLKTAEIPEELRQYIQEKVAGNPFYLEEMLTSLTESGTLLRREDHWQLARTINDSDIPPTIHAVISDRIDRLEWKAKHLLQEASVLGRTVPYEILKGITEYPDSLDRSLVELELLDLIRIDPHSEQEYIFKHALIQEAVYGSLLKRDRQAIHQRIGLVMEQVFQDRLPEFYETLAFHFRHSDLSQKAIDYLRKSGRKSLQKYAVQESHQYYHRAFQILGKTSYSDEEKWFLIDFLNEWALVFYYRADFKGFTRLFLEHKELAESLSDKALLGIFYGWLSIAVFCIGKAKESYEYSIKALKLGEESRSYSAIGLAYANLTWCCAELKLLDQGIQYGEEALAKGNELEPMAYFQSLGGLGMIYLFKGDGEKNYELGRILLEYGENHSDLRSSVVGYICTSYAHYTEGDFSGAAEWGNKAVALSNDPLFSVWPKLVLANYYTQSDQFQAADEILREIIPFCQHLGMDYTVTSAQALHGAVLLAKGQFSRGLRAIEAGFRLFTDNGRFYSRYLLEFSLAEIYFRMATRAQPLGFWAAIKNLGFILKEVPFAKRKAEAYLGKLIHVGKEVGARGFLHGQAFLNLGLLYQLNGRKKQARECLGEAQRIFAQCNSETGSQRIQQALAAMS